MNPAELNEPLPDEEVEIITADETTQEYDIGDAPPEDDDEGMEGDEGSAMEQQGEEIPDSSLMTFKIHSGPVYSVKVHPLDPRIVLSGGGDDVGIIWNREDGSILHRLEGHTDTVASVDFSFDGKYAATGGFDGVVKVWEVATGKLVQTLEGPSQEVEWVSWHKKGNVVLAGSGDGTVWMWLASTGECMQVFAGHEDGVTCGSFTGSGKMIVTGSTDQTVRVWNPKTGECTHVFRGHDFVEGPICFLTCHPSQPLIICGSQDGTARLMQVQTKRVIGIFSHDVNEALSGTVNSEVHATENSVECGGFCNTMNWAATGCLGGALRIWDLSTYQCRHVCQHPAGVTKLLWHPTQPIVYTCTVEGLIYVWDARTGQQLRVMGGHEDMILDMAFINEPGNATPIGLLSGSDDETVRLFPVSE
ncbi:hypothetical protein Poli38472_005959 [Pythium oligandrum]|uniref:Angio-associated migratory cell protein n=1 Tax=Pythium oligandrum TaxID=41045 RepID=A0A8K1FMQ3_PYTOL|nr:hypothetical protein Poli38472_005959 [Pythium oligandrum]|eukprot:TMW68491.1 hypothetical protein Poli38472_005959 [Pythium oligandrum]